jgi:hypothetical protein
MQIISFSPLISITTFTLHSMYQVLYHCHLGPNFQEVITFEQKILKSVWYQLWEISRWAVQIFTVNEFDTSTQFPKRVRFLNFLFSIGGKINWTETWKHKKNSESSQSDLFHCPGGCHLSHFQHHCHHWYNCRHCHPVVIATLSSVIKIAAITAVASLTTVTTLPLSSHTANCRRRCHHFNGFL